MLKWRIGSVEWGISLLFPAAIVAMLSLGDARFTMQCLLASLLHEGGHFLAMLLLGDRPSRVVLGVFGARVERRRAAAVGYGVQAIVSLSGPLANLLCAMILYRRLGHAEVVLIHALLGTFHLLPVAGLDGGEAVHALLCRRFSPHTAHTVSLALSVVVLLPLSVLGFWLLLQTRYNASLLILTIYLIILLIFKEND